MRSYHIIKHYSTIRPSNEMLSKAMTSQEQLGNRRRFTTDYGYRRYNKTDDKPLIVDTSDRKSKDDFAWQYQRQFSLPCDHYRVVSRSLFTIRI